MRLAGGELNENGTSSIGRFPLGRVIHAETADESVNVYAHACNDASLGMLGHYRFENGRADVDFRGPVLFGTAGDFDGDGLVDLAYGDDTSLHLERAVVPNAFASVESTDLELGGVSQFRVYSVDVDLDGSEEVIVGEPTGSSIHYFRLDLEPC